MIPQLFVESIDLGMAEHHNESRLAKTRFDLCSKNWKTNLGTV